MNQKINSGGIMINFDLCEIGIRIQQCRKSRGFTQEHLAEAMNVSIQMISNVERGNKAIRIDNLVNLSRILRVSTDYCL
jgi:transcriptional regulator with XRE-family HTH domain